MSFVEPVRTAPRQSDLTLFPYMKTHRFTLNVAVCASLLTSCASTKIPTRQFTSSEPEAVSIVSACQKAHGGEAFSRVRDLSVRYEGKWGPIGPRFQPVLVDSKFRGDSEERLILTKRLMAQVHTGPSGTKNVLRQPDQIAVAYNGVPSTDVEVKQAAALVADAYTMFLMGPFYFHLSHTVFSVNGESKVDGELCDEVLAVLQPGFGIAEEDRVLLFISRSSKRLRRVRMTINGLESTRGAEVDVTFSDFRKIGGVLWPTDFDERIRSPFDLHAHHWNLRGLEINRGLVPADLSLEGWTDRASRPTSSLTE